jgi:hypothetical protein
MRPFPVIALLFALAQAGCSTEPTRPLGATGLREDVELRITSVTAEPGQPVIVDFVATNHGRRIWHSTGCYGNGFTFELRDPNGAELNLRSPCWVVLACAPSAEELASGESIAGTFRFDGTHYDRQPLPGFECPERQAAPGKHALIVRFPYTVSFGEPDRYGMLEQRVTFDWAGVNP